MHLYGTKASPFVQRVLMSARVKGHALEARTPPGEGGMRSAEFRAISPLGRIPVLALDDGATIIESDAICGYLDETLPGPALLPETPLARARVREIVALATLEIAAGLRPLLIHRVFRPTELPDVVAAATAQIEGGLAALAGLLDPVGPFACGGALTAADCALVPILTLAHAIEPMAGTWSMVAAQPPVASYYEAMLGDPLARRTVDEMHAGFAAIMARTVKA